MSSDLMKHLVSQIGCLPVEYKGDYKSPTLESWLVQENAKEFKFQSQTSNKQIKKKNSNKYSA